MKTTFDNLLLQTLPKLRGYAILLTNNRQDADDLLQQTAYRALRGQNQFAIGTNFGGWLYRIFRNEFITSMRQKRTGPACIDDFPEELFGKAADQESKTLLREVLKALDTLPAIQREALTLVCAGNMSYEDASSAMNCSIGTIKSRVNRARASLAKLLDPTDKGMRCQQRTQRVNALLGAEISTYGEGLQTSSTGNFSAAAPAEL